MPELAALLLAAGGSSRLGRPKQLVRLPDGESLVHRSARLAVRVADSVTVVLGSEADAVAEALGDLPVRIVINDRWNEGLSSSLRCGVESLPENARGVLAMLCDQYRIDDKDLDRLVAAWQQQPERTVAARYRDRPGVPAIFPAARVPELRRLEGDRGAQALLRTDPAVLTVPVEHASLDLDTPEELARLGS